MTVGVRRRRILRLAFWAYAAVLLTATHWPSLTLEGPIERPDLVLHLAAFAVWGALLAASGIVAPVGAARNGPLSALVGGLYASFDELTQGIPFLHRTVGLDDLAANFAGVLTGAFVAAAVARRAGRRSGPRLEPPQRSATPGE